MHQQQRGVDAARPDPEGSGRVDVGGRARRRRVWPRGGRRQRLRAVEDDRGATAVEYVLFVSLCALVIFGAVQVMSAVFEDTFNRSMNTVQTGDLPADPGQSTTTTRPSSTTTTTRPATTTTTQATTTTCRRRC